MASFDFFSQPQGPQVSISLFGDAASQGVNAGNASPTPLTSIIQGGIKGIDTGLDIVNKIQNIELKQNAIDQLPVENQIRATQAKNAEAIAEINVLTAERDTTLQGLKLDDDRAKLEASTTKLKQDKLLREKSDAFFSSFQQADPVTQAQLVLGGQFQDVFAGNKNLYNQLLQQVAVNPNNGLDAATRNEIGGFLRKKSVQDAYEKAAAANLPRYLEAEAALTQDSITGDLIKKTGLSPQQTYKNIQFVDHGRYAVGPNGRDVLIDPKTGEPVQTPVNRGGEAVAKLGGWDILFHDPRNNSYQIISQGLDDGPKKLFDKWVAQKAIQDGSAMRSDIEAIDREGSKANTVVKKDFSSVTAEGAVPLRETIAKNTLGVTDSVVQKIAPLLSKIETDLVATRLNPNREASSVMLENTVVSALSKKIAYTQFEESPALQSQYTQGDVEAYNKELETSVVTKIGRSSNISSERLKELIAPFQTDSPKDLYYKKQQSVITQNVRRMLSQYSELANQKAKAQFLRQSSTQRLLSDLSSIARGQ